MRFAAAAGVAFTLLGVPTGAAEAAGRVAVVIGNNAGDGGEARLRYAESDARRIADVLIAVGQVAPADVIRLEGQHADAVRLAIARAEERLLQAGDGLLIIYYSGHADAEALHLDGTRLPLRDIQTVLRGSTVATRLLILDACRSGALTYVKGGRAGGHFDMTGTLDPTPRGLAIVASSAPGEDAQESDALRSSFFTHHLAIALLGAADANGDGAVTLAEAFAYAARHTTASTADTWVGPQHPTYRLDLGGREDLILTRPGAAAGADYGHLTLGEAGSYLVRREGDEGLTAEIASDAVNRPLALRAGRYEVTKRGPDHLLTGTFEVAAASSTGVTAAHMRRVEYGRAVRKGGTATTIAAGLYASGGYRGSLAGLGGAAIAGVGARVDMHRLSATLSFDFGAGSIDGARGTDLRTTELGVRAGAFHAFDLSRLTLALGAEIGASRFGQSASDQPLTGHSYAGHAGPALILEAPIHRRFFASLQAGAPFYLINAASVDRAGAQSEVHVTYRVALTAGGFLR